MKSADSPSKFIPFASMTLILSPLSLIMGKLRGGCLQISLKPQQSQHWRLACNGKHQVEFILSDPRNLKMCRTGCRDGSKWMWHLYLLVFIQTSCVPLRSLHIRKCWSASFSSAGEASLCLIFVYIHRVLAHFAREADAVLLVLLIFCSWTVMSRCVLYDSEQEVDFTELQLLPPPPLYADTF